MNQLVRFAAPVHKKEKQNSAIKERSIQLSSALDITESRLGRGWKSARRRCWCDDGLISVARALFTHSPPSTVPIRTREFVIADLRIFRRFGEYDTVWLRLWRFASKFLWKLHRNDPGCVVGEHKHVFFFPPAAAGVKGFRLTEKERFGEVARLSMENRTEDDAV